jgi:hypothetical protein
VLDTRPVAACCERSCCAAGALLPDSCAHEFILTDPRRIHIGLPIARRLIGACGKPPFEEALRSQRSTRREGKEAR